MELYEMPVMTDTNKKFQGGKDAVLRTGLSEIHDRIY